jgi:hypothetical protein
LAASSRWASIAEGFGSNADARKVSAEHISLWLTLAYGLAVPVIAVVYWRAYGPANFLWFPISPSPAR